MPFIRSEKSDLGQVVLQSNAEGTALVPAFDGGKGAADVARWAKWLCTAGGHPGIYCSGIILNNLRCLNDLCVFLDVSWWLWSGMILNFMDFHPWLMMNFWLFGVFLFGIHFHQGISFMGNAVRKRRFQRGIHMIRPDLDGIPRHLSTIFLEVLIRPITAYNNI